MRKCWKDEPKERPTFEEIRESINNMLNDEEVKIIGQNLKKNPFY